MQDNRTIYEDCDFITWILYKNAPLIRHYRQLSPTSVYVCFLVLLSMYMLGHGDECIVWRKWTRVCRSCETDAFRRPAARPFVQDAQSAVRLPVSPSRRSRDRLSGSRKALWASRTNRLAAGRRPASRSRSRGNHTREVSYAIQSIRRRALTYLVATPTPAPFAFLSAGYLPASMSGSMWRREMAVSIGVSRGSEVAYSRIYMRAWMQL